MPIDPGIHDANHAATERIRSLRVRLSDDDLRRRVGDHWTVAITLAHLAFWDRRALDALDRTAREGKVTELEIDLVVNDLSLPLWAAIPPREAVRLAIEAAQAVDARVDDNPSEHRAMSLVAPLGLPGNTRCTRHFEGASR
jgi:hypothetical protein